MNNGEGGKYAWRQKEKKKTKVRPSDNLVWFIFIVIPIIVNKTLDLTA